jgi:hypothetical protein
MSKDESMQQKWQHYLLPTLTGAVVGLVVGALVTVALVVSAVSSVAESRGNSSIPGLIEVRYVGDTLQANSGGGLFLPALLAMALGIVVALSIVRHRSLR